MVDLFIYSTIRLSIESYLIIRLRAIEIINREVILMSRKGKVVSNVKKCINESKSNNTNIDFNVDQLKTTNVY